MLLRLPLAQSHQGPTIFGRHISKVRLELAGDTPICLALSTVLLMSGSCLSGCLFRRFVRAGVFASGGEDKLIAVWDLERQDKMPGGGEEAGPDAKKARTIGASLPPQLMFHHAGHRSQVGAFLCVLEISC